MAAGIPEIVRADTASGLDSWRSDEDGMLGAERETRSAADSWRGKHSGAGSSPKRPKRESGPHSRPSTKVAKAALLDRPERPRSRIGLVLAGVNREVGADNGEVLEHRAD
jgi:hypothetical protein